MELSEKITLIKNLLNEILSSISSLSSLNFDDMINKIMKDIERVKNLKLELKKDFKTDALREHEGELVFLSDQIKNKFANLILDFNRQKQEAALLLQMTSNKRKLELYKR